MLSYLCSRNQNPSLEKQNTLYNIDWVSRAAWMQMWHVQQEGLWHAVQALLSHF